MQHLDCKEGDCVSLLFEDFFYCFMSQDTEPKATIGKPFISQRLFLAVCPPEERQYQIQIVFVPQNREKQPYQVTIVLQRTIFINNPSMSYR